MCYLLPLHSRTSSLHYLDNDVDSLRPLGPSQQQGFEDVVAFVRDQKADAETLVISQPQTEQYNKAVANLEIIKDAAIWKNKPSEDELPTPQQVHEWLSSKEDSEENRKRYMEYLCNPDNIKLPDGTQLFEGSSEKDLLSVRFSEFENVKTSGNIDVIMVYSHHQCTATVRQNILVGIELKKDTNKKNGTIERQVTLQHIAASYLNPNTGVLTIMTDLNNRWWFYYFAEDKRLLRYEASKSEAIFLIQHSLNKSDEEERLPDYFLKRACWNDMYRKLDPIPETNSLDERGGENSERESDGGSTHSKDYSKRSSEQSGRSSNQQSGNSKRCRSSKQGQMDDPSMDYMDEEERLGAMLLREIQTSFHKMLYVPEVEGVEDIDIPPLEIF